MNVWSLASDRATRALVAREVVRALMRNGSARER